MGLLHGGRDLSKGVEGGGWLTEWRNEGVGDTYGVCNGKKYSRRQMDGQRNWIVVVRSIVSWFVPSTEYCLRVSHNIFHFESFRLH